MLSRGQMSSKSDRDSFPGQGRGRGTHKTTIPNVSHMSSKSDRGSFGGRERGGGEGRAKGKHTTTTPSVSATAPSTTIPIHSVTASGAPNPTHSAPASSEANHSVTASGAPNPTHSAPTSSEPTFAEASTSSGNDSRGLFRWDSIHDREIQKIWRAKSAKYVCQSLGDIRRGRSAGTWMPEKVLRALKEKWMTDPHFQRMSDQNKKNIAANKDGYEKQLGRSVSIPEVFLKVNYNEKIGKWVTSKAKGTFTAYKKLKASKIAQGITNIDDSQCFYEATGGCNKKGHAYGFGSEASFYSSTSSNSSSSGVIDVQQLCHRLGALEQRNELLESELASIRSLLLKISSTSRFSSGYDASFSAVPNAIHDDKDDEDNEDLGDDEYLGDDEDLGDDEGDIGCDGDDGMECDEGDL
ncbi:hypothetical protein PHJA_001151700 [Phtheirospermum japonicum]|uniref:Transposase n=1 Tax=Phtheirospermum japonicum TaxID=374723 RepID=A0A830BV75_9LAMI|nr:hypothetical protein PHJA_001151700 [Phtheirospermum japonicum]